jgi:uncharacterized protein (TIGR02284 family)
MPDDEGATPETAGAQLIEDAAVADELKSLHTAAIDSINGYEEARLDAEGGGMTPLFQELITLHTRNAADLAAELHRSGVPAGDDGSFMSTVNRTIMSIRSLFGGLGESVLPGLIDGEERNVSHYDRALELPALPPTARGVCLNNRTRLEDAIEKMRSFRREPGSPPP